MAGDVHANGRYLDQSEEGFQRYHAQMIRERNDGDAQQFLISGVDLMVIIDQNQPLW